MRALGLQVEQALLERATPSSLSPRPHLSDELAPLIHTDVFLTLSPLDAHPASERVCLHYELGCGEGENGGNAIVGEFGMDICTQLYLKWITNKDLLYNTGNSAQCYVAAWMRGESGGQWIHIYV